MAKFLRIHHENEDGDIEIYIANLEMITAIDEEEKTIDLADGESICVVRDNEWRKLMSFVESNMADEI